MALPLHVQLLGDFRVTQGESPVTSLGSPRLQSLLAYLLLHRSAPQPRQRVAFLLWPDSSEKQARTNLRQLLHHLRAALPDADSYLVADTQTLQWNPDAPATLDAAKFEAAVARAEAAGGDDARSALEEAIRCYRGALMPACYEEWIEPERERLHQLHVTALDRLIRLHEERRDYRAAIERAHLLLQQDDLREVTYRDLMRLHALSGDRAGAVKVFQQCQAVLERELGVQPSPQTRDVYARIRNASYPLELQADESARAAAARLPLIGRHDEWQRMLAVWEHVVAGNPHILFVEGEAGIGKTRLTEELLSWAASQGITTARSQCHAAEGRLAYAPVTEWLRSQPFRESMVSLEGVWLAELALVLPELLTARPELAGRTRMAESWRRPHFFEALARAVAATPRPIMLMIDDLQWCDAGTLEWLHYLLRFDPSAELLIVGTVRTEEVEPEHPLELLRLDLRRTGQASEIQLGPLAADEAAQLASEVADQALHENRTLGLYRETEGNPLFVVEHVRAGLTTAELEPEPRGHHPLPQRAGLRSLPPKVHAVITARLNQPSAAAREVLALAAAVGRSFTFDLLVEAGEQHEVDVVRALEELGRRRIIEERGGGSYDFSHEKLREVAYDSISPVRRRLLHRHVARALETLHAPEIDSVCGHIAVHYDVGGLPRDAIPHHQRAAELARAVYADQEALGHLARAEALLSHLPAAPETDERELAILLLKGPSLASVKGYTAPEVGQTYQRARALCLSESLAHHLPAVLWGLYTFHIVRGEIAQSHELGSQLLELASREDDPAPTAVGHFTVGSCLFHTGRFLEAAEQLRLAVEHYDRRQHQVYVTRFGPDPGVFALAYLAHALWHLGYPEQAVGASEKAVRLARELSHPFSETIALDYGATLHQFRREPAAAGALAEAAVALSTRYGFSYYLGWATIMQGWRRTWGDDPESGIHQIHRGLEALRNQGAGLRRPYYVGLLGEAYARLGRAERAAACLEEARTAMTESGESWMAPELHRLEGELLLAQGADADAAAPHFFNALKEARHQHSRALELRTAAGLVRLGRSNSDGEGAREVLQDALGRFTEGFSTPDLEEAAALLEGPSQGL